MKLRLPNALRAALAAVATAALPLATTVANAVDSVNVDLSAPNSGVWKWNGTGWVKGTLNAGSSITDWEYGYTWASATSNPVRFNGAGPILLIDGIASEQIDNGTNTSDGGAVVAINNSRAVVGAGTYAGHVYVEEGSELTISATGDQTLKSVSTSGYNVVAYGKLTFKQNLTFGGAGQNHRRYIGMNGMITLDGTLSKNGKTLSLSIEAYGADLLGKNVLNRETHTALSAANIDLNGVTITYYDALSGKQVTSFNGLSPDKHSVSGGYNQESLVWSGSADSWGNGVSGWYIQGDALTTDTGFINGDNVFFYATGSDSTVKLSTDVTTDSMTVAGSYTFGDGENERNLTIRKTMAIEDGAHVAIAHVSLQASDLVVKSGSSLTLGGSLEAETITLSGGESTVGFTNSGQDVLKGKVTGNADKFTIQNTGTIRGWTANDYVAPTVIGNGDTLVYDAENSLTSGGELKAWGDAANGVTFNQGRVKFDNLTDEQAYSISQSITVAGVTTLTFNSGNITFSNNLDINAAFTLADAESLTFSGMVDTTDGSLDLSGISTTIGNGATLKIGTNTLTNNDTITFEYGATLFLVGAEANSRYTVGTLTGFDNITDIITGAGRAEVMYADGVITITGDLQRKELTWNNSGDGVWSTADKWLDEDGDAESYYDGDTVTFSTDGSKAVTLGGNISAAGMTVTGADYTFSAQEGTSPNLEVTGTLNITANAHANLGVDTSVGTLTVESGSGLKVATGKTLTVGGEIADKLDSYFAGVSADADYTGEIVMSGATIAESQMTAGTKSINGNFHFTSDLTFQQQLALQVGANASMAVDGHLNMAAAGEVLNIIGGAVSARKLTVGGIESNGTVTLSDGSLTVGDITLGNASGASFNMTGGTLNFTNSGSGEALVLNGSGSASMSITGGTVTTDSARSIGADVTLGGVAFEATGEGSGLSFTGAVEWQGVIQNNSGHLDFSGSLAMADSVTEETIAALDNTTTYCDPLDIMSLGNGYIGKLIVKNAGTATTSLGSGITSVTAAGTTYSVGASAEGVYIVNTSGTYQVNTGTVVYGELETGNSAYNASAIKLTGGTLELQSNLKENVQVTLTAASTLKLGENTTLKRSDVASGHEHITLDGSGVFDNGESLQKDYTIDNNWGGTIIIRGRSNSGELQFDTFRNGGTNSSITTQSTVQCNGVSGWIPGGTSATILSNIAIVDSNVVGLEITATSNRTYTFQGTISGTGTMAINTKNSAHGGEFVFSGDVSMWSGTLTHSANDDSTIVTTLVFSHAGVIGLSDISHDAEHGGSLDVQFIGSEDQTFAGSLKDVKLTASGAGSLTLSGENQVTEMVVSNGALKVTGSITSTSSVAVSGSGVLEISGADDATVTAGGITAKAKGTSGTAKNVTLASGSVTGATSGMGADGDPLKALGEMSSLTLSFAAENTAAEISNVTMRDVTLSGGSVNLGDNVTAVVSYATEAPAQASFSGMMFYGDGSSDDQSATATTLNATPVLQNTTAKGTLTVDVDSGLLSPANAGATLVWEILRDVTIADGTNFTLQFGSVLQYLLSTGHEMTLSGTLVDGATVTLATSGTDPNINANGLYTGGLITGTAGSLVLTITNIPEPTTGTLAVLALAALAARRRRK